MNIIIKPFTNRLFLLLLFLCCYLMLHAMMGNAMRCNISLDKQAFTVVGRTSGRQAGAAHRDRMRNRERERANGVFNASVIWRASERRNRSLIQQPNAL